MSNRVFGDKEIIEASRQFVCVRPDSYESEANQELVRALLRGTMQNTAFCLLSPDGNERLSRSGRSFGDDIGGASGLDRVALQFRSKGDPLDALTPDFHSFRMALNISAADSRVLVLISAPADQIGDAEKRMRSVAWNDDIVGRFHYDFESNAAKFIKPLGLRNTKSDSGIYLVDPDRFGVSGQVVQRLPIDVDNEKLIAAMKTANSQYAKVTERKIYSQHVAEGHRSGYFFEMAMPYGEDRNGDGVPDPDSARKFDSAKSQSLRTGNYYPDNSEL
ncbi:MAG: hypothetical protein HKN47_28990 [Pirellulaceae bacterium]|nr:hypothetical protein [Pirellulaceae bacterium]